MCKCVLYCCHQVTTQFQLTNISYHIINLCLKCGKGEKEVFRKLLQLPTPLHKNMTMHATVPDTRMNFVILMHIFFLQEYKQSVQKAIYKSNFQPMCHRPPQGPTGIIPRAQSLESLQYTCRCKRYVVNTWWDDLTNKLCSEVDCADFCSAQAPYLCIWRCWNCSVIPSTFWEATGHLSTRLSFRPICKYTRKSDLNTFS